MSRISTMLVLLLSTRCAASDLVPRPEETARIRGVVQDRDGRPLPGARVRATERVGSFDRIAGETRTGEDGRFELRWLDPGSYELWAEQTGFGTQTVLLSLSAGDEAEKSFVLRSVGVLYGRVSDRIGRPLEEARLLVRRSDGSVLLEAPAKPDASGCYELDGLAPGSYWITALAPGHAPDTASLPVSMDPASSVRADFRLGSGGTIRLLAREAPDRPLSGRAIRIDRIVGGVAFPVTELGTWSADPPRLVVTDSSGVAEVSRLEPGTYQVQSADGAVRAGEILVREGVRANVILEIPS
jgi:carboxypeptidase family protein